MSRVTCLNCNSANTARIIYGMPDFSEKLERDLEAGRVSLGGCSMAGDDPNRHCNDCQADFNTNKPFNEPLVVTAGEWQEGDIFLDN